MKDYSTIIILYFSGGSDNVPEDNAEYIVIKALSLQKHTIIIPLNESRSSGSYDLSEYKPQIRGSACVYVVGHGTETSRSVGNCNASDLAETIKSLVGQYQLKRVCIVACHSGGNGNETAPHRFVTEFWEHVKGSVEEVVGYTGSVRLTLDRKTVRPNQATPDGFMKYQFWNGEQWLIKRGSVRKIVSHEHDEGANRRKIYVSANGTFSKGWVGKL